MTIRVLGFTEVDDGALSPRDRKVLAALAVRPGRAVSLDVLADASWGDALPGTWQKQLQATISRVRRILGPRAIVTTPAGYALDDGVAIDVSTFERELAAARLHWSADEPDRAVEAYRRALALWRGPAFADLPDWPPARDDAARLAELRRVVEEELQEAQLECGEHRSVATVAEQLVRDAPLRESRWRLLALAHYRSGRQADALAALRAARRLLVDELGIAPGPELVELERAILQQDAALRPSPRPPRPREQCPYRGLHPFDLDDAADFHGRDPLVATATARLERTGILVLTGGSGCGKSSLALAGVGASLAAQGRVVEVLRPSPQSASMLEGAHVGRRLVVVDQFEEVLSLEGDERTRFCAAIAGAAGRGIPLLLTVRSDLLDRAATLPGIGTTIAANVLVVTPMSRAELREAIEAPARHAGLRLEAGLTELLLRDAADAPGALPLVSHALSETWARREGGMLTVAGYEAAGGIAGAVARSADALYAELDERERRLCRDLMLRLVERGVDGHPVRRRLRTGADDDAARRRILAKLVRTRLVTVEEDAVVLTHESIAVAWPQLSAWLEQDAGDTRVMQQLALAAQAWRGAGEQDEDLLRGARLAATTEWRDRTAPALTATEARFLDTSIERERDDAAALSARAVRDRRQNRRLRAALAGAGALLVASVLAASVAVVRSGESDRSAAAASAAREDAAIEALLGAALSLRGEERDVSALLAAELWRRWPDDPRSRVALMGVLTASGGLVSTSYIDADWIGGALIPGTEQAFLVEEGTALSVRDAATGAVVRRRSFDHDDPLTATLAVSADGRVAAVLGSNDVGSLTLHVFDTATLARTADPVPLETLPAALALSRGGDRAVLAAADASVTVVDIAAGTTRSTGPALTPDAVPEVTPAAAVLPLPDGRILLGTPEAELRILDPDTLEILARVAVPPRSTSSALVRLDDGTIVASGEQRMVAIDLDAAAVRWSRPLASSKPTACVRLAAAGSSAYCEDSFGGVTEHALADGHPTGRRFDTQLAAAAAIDVTSDGTALLVVGQATPTLSFSRLDGSGAASRIVARGKVALEGFGLGGTRLVVADRDGATYDRDLTAYSIWNPAQDAATGVLAGRVEGAGWFGDDLVTGYRPDEDEFLFVRASTGAVVDGGPVPDGARRTWVSPSGRRSYVAVSEPDGDGAVVAFDGETGTPLPLRIELGNALPWSVSASSDDALVAVTRVIGGAARTGVFDGETGDPVVDGLDGPAVTAIGRGELFAAEGGRITRHDLRTLALRDALPGAHGEINSLQLDSAGRTLVATANDDTVSVYDVASGRRLGDPLRADSPLIVAGMLRPDGEELAVNVAQGVQLWDLRPATQFAAACRIAGRELTAKEWTAYLLWVGDPDPVCADVLDARD